MIRVAVLIPVLNRPDRVAPLVESLRESVAGSVSLQVTAAFVCSPDDRKEQQAVEKTGLTPLVYKEPAGPGDYAKKINWAATVHENAEWLFLGADDLFFEPGWLEAGLVEHFRSNACVIGSNDAANIRTSDGRASTHTLVHRSYLECGTIDGKGLLHEGYDHNFCNPPDAPIWMADCSFKALGDVRVGDSVIGWNHLASDRPQVGAPLRTMCYSEVLGVRRRSAQLVRVEMESGRVFHCTPDHRWLNAWWSPSLANRRGGGTEWVTPEVGRTLLHVIDEPAPLGWGLERTAGWLAGIYDGEGSGIMVATQSSIHNPAVMAAIEVALDEVGVNYRHTVRKSGVGEFVLNGGRQGYLDFLTWINPVRRESLQGHITGWRARVSSRSSREIIGARRFGQRDKIVAVSPAESRESEVISMTTTSGNYIAWGYASRNCDDEFVGTAKHRETYSHAADSIVRHMHPTFRTAKMDSTYEKALAHFDDDRRLFGKRAPLWSKARVA